MCPALTSAQLLIVSVPLTDFQALSGKSLYALAYELGGLFAQDLMRSSRWTTPVDVIVIQIACGSW